MVETRGNALITNFRRAAERHDLLATALPERRRTVARVIGKAVAAKQPDCRPQVVIGPQIEAVCVEDLFP